MKKHFLSHILPSSAMALTFCLVFALNAFAAFPTGWQYRKSHVVNSATGAGTDYQVRIIAYYGAGTDSGESVYLNSHSRTDFGDVRFVSSDGVTELDYWMETGSLSTGVSATFWVKIADDLGAANQTIYIYYGNAAETTTSNGDNTFIFFDDFNVDLSKWVKEKEIAPGVITLNAASSYVRCGGGSTSIPYGHTSLGSSPSYSSFENGAIEVRLKESVNALAEIAYRGNFGANTGYKGRYDCRTGNESPHMRPPYDTWVAFGTAVPRFGFGTDTWFRGTVSVTSSGGSYTHRIFRNGVLMSTTTDTTYAGPGEIALQNHYGSYSDYDWVAVRNFVYPEPAHDAWGTEDPLQATFSLTKSVNVQIDADTSQTITPGDRLRYNMKIQNIGNVIAVGATVADLVPSLHTTYVPGSAAATSGSASYNGGTGEIEWTGDADVGVLIVITFDVTVNAGTPLGTVVSNSGTLNYDSDNDGANDTALQTDGKPILPGIQTTDFTVGGPAHGFGTKAAADLDLDGDGILEPGDTVRYTITITNNSGFVPWVPLEFYDTMPANTSYVPGSATVTDVVLDPLRPSPPYYPPPIVYTEHVPSISFTDPVLSITGIDIAATAPDNVVTITFDVLLDNPFPDGATTISNQADVIYDSDGDGINDTLQSTDGDSGTPGNQPTVSAVTVGTISGTVFEDNGSGGGTSGDGIQNGAEPGMSGVNVNVFDAFINLLYPTDLNGDYIFTGLPSGTYTVQETVPAYCTATSPNPVAGLALAAGGTASVDFGNQVNGHADIKVRKYCATVCPDGADQLVFYITVTNDGPDAATNVILTDDLDALSLAGLSNINYTLDGGALTPWPVSNSLPPWGTMTAGESHIIRIYATVAADFSPLENTATVVSDIYDPLTGDNTSSCANPVCSGNRGALLFNPAANASVTVASASSLELTTTGTIEAWIHPAAFFEDAGIIVKGTASPCYGMGLGGGDPGDIFDEGTARNIGFVLYDASGGKYLLTADGVALTDHEWHHVACSWTGAAPGNIDMRIYINGILEASETAVFADTFRFNDEDLVIGFHGLTSSNYEGVIDEVRVWDAARTPLRIQDTMCRKITSLDPDYTDLMGNWRLDEKEGVVCGDFSGYDNIGITNAEQICSEAPVGDDSDHDYTDLGGFIVIYDNPAGDDRLTVSAEVPADWSEALKSGIQVYRVESPPDYIAGPAGMRLPRPDGYFGVFVTGDAYPTYIVEYNYDVTDDGIPGITSETNFRLAFREANCRPWKDVVADQDILLNTLTQGGLSGTEFILGSYVDPRNAILYDGTDDFVNVPDAAGLRLTTDGTLEAWIYITAYQTNAGIIAKWDTVDDGYLLTTDSVIGDNIVFALYESGGPSSDSVTSATTLNTDTWYHIAATWDGTNMNLYINGVLDTNSKASTQFAGSTAGSNLTIGTDGTNFFQGRIDEARVWEAARTQTQVRAAMCQKLAGTETNLVAYWRFDEETNLTNCPDYTANGNNGTMDVSPGFSNNGGTYYIEDARVCSSAPIGDDSAYGYYDGGALSPVTATLAHSDGDFMTVTENAGGTWNVLFSGLHIYRLDEAPVYPPDLWDDAYYTYTTPNGLTPPATWSSIDYYRYWGVFVTDWANEPPFDVVYTYTGNPSVPVDDSQLGLARRPEYCFGTWSASGATLNIGADTLTLTADSLAGAPRENPEYVLGGIDDPLAIVLASFTATPKDGCVDINWETATEIDTLGFQLWRSTEKSGPYAPVPGGFIQSMALVETTGASYDYTDCDVETTSETRYYYKLEEIDMDDAKDNAFYGPIGPVSENVTAAQGNGNDSGGDKACFIDAVLWR